MRNRPSNRNLAEYIESVREYIDRLEDYADEIESDLARAEIEREEALSDITDLRDELEALREHYSS